MKHNDRFRTMLVLALFVAVLSVACHKPVVQNSTIDEAQSMTISDNISNQTIHAFAEDDNGHVWIATFRGLNKFDGQRYYQYFSTDDSTGLADNNIMDVMIDAKRRVWVGTVSGVCLYTAQNTFERIPANDQNKNFVQVISSQRGRVFAFNVSSVFEYEERLHRFVRRIGKMDPQKTFTGRIAIDINDVLWHAYGNQLTAYTISDWRHKRNYRLPSGFFIMNANLLDGDKLWLTGSAGAVCFDTRQRTSLSLPENLTARLVSAGGANHVQRLDENTILFSTMHNGLLALNERTGEVVDGRQPTFPFQPPSFRVTVMFSDSRHNLWMGSDDQGFAVNYQNSSFFDRNSYVLKTIGHQSVLALAVDHSGNLFISTKMNGLYAYNLSTRKLQPVDIEGLSSGVNRQEVSCLLVDHNNNLWMSCGTTVIKSRFEGERLHIVRRWDAFYPMSLTEDRDGTVWASLATYSVAAFLPNGEMRMVQVYPATFCFMPSIMQLRDGRILTAAFHQDLTTVNPSDFSVRRLPVPADSMKKAIRRSVFIPTAMLQTDDSTLFIGTVTNGLLRLSLNTWHAQRIHGLSCSDVGAIALDRQGHLWVSTMNGLNRVDRSTGIVTSFFEADGIGGNQFNDRAACLLPDGRLIFGGTHGLTILNPENRQTLEQVRLVFETLKVHNQVIEPRKGGCIDSILEKRPVIRLSHNDNNFEISYATLAYGDHERVNYFYKLEGLDNDWIEMGNRREIYFSNIPAGSYKLRVKACSKGYPTFEAENDISIVIDPAPWNSWWAWMIYLSLASIVILRLRSIRLRVLRGKMEMEQARREKEHEQKINAMNMSFFTNISHEFRTPLTMIAGPVSMLCDDKTLPADKHQLLLVVQRSVKRMLDLVNQLLDFHKLENDTLRLQVSRKDIIGLTCRICELFRINAKEKHVSLRMEGLEDSFLMMLDADKLDKILTNLLSNAMKHTPTGGTITVSFDAVDGKAMLSVSDEGPGVPPSEFENIFRRFYQLDDKRQGVVNWGTGIGLYYSRRLAMLHHGTLTVDNRAGGRGAVFTLTLPTDDAAYAADEHERQTENKLEDLVSVDNDLNSDLDDSLHDTAPENKSLVMIVDDDPEVVNYLKMLLTPHYRVSCCFDAESAYQAVGEEEPNIILCDVIMPGKDGYEFCRDIKNNLQLCHIPVVLVTAKALVENQVEGLNTGADAYITKPFAPNVLLATIHSMLDNREKVRRLLSQSTQAGGNVGKALSPRDRDFMEQLYHVMEEEMSNSDLDVTRLTERLHVSRTKLYYKMKGLTGTNPSAFFKTYKLNRAAELIKEGKYTMAEVADMTGFSTPSHFSTSFKKQFGVSPSEFVGASGGIDSANLLYYR